MAGDWIKMTVGLGDCPEVIALADAFDMPTDQVVGVMFRFWSWADSHLEDGHARGVTPKWLDDFIRVPKFTENLAKVGWIHVGKRGLSIPSFDKHMSQSAKSRALATRRKQSQRSQKRHARGGTETRPEKRREESITNTPPAPSAPPARAREGSPAMGVIFEWEKHRGRPLSHMEAEQVQQSCEQFGAVRVREAVDAAVKAAAKSWKYVEVALENGNSKAPKPRPPKPKKCPCGRTLGPHDAKLCYACRAKEAPE